MYPNQVRSVYSLLYPHCKDDLHIMVRKWQCPVGSHLLWRSPSFDHQNTCKPDVIFRCPLAFDISKLHEGAVFQRSSVAPLIPDHTRSKGMPTQTFSVNCSFFQYPRHFVAFVHWVTSVYNL